MALIYSTTCTSSLALTSCPVAISNSTALSALLSGDTRCQHGLVRMNNIWDTRLPSLKVIFAQPTVVAGVGGNAVKAELVLGGINFVQEAVQCKDAGSFRFAEHLAGSHAAVGGFDFGR